MSDNRIEPEKITHPFQLMAAWFVMLILLVSILLAGAARIQSPPWIPGFLCISAVVLALLVMFFVLLMLTRFRPHLQGPKEYSEWLQDERKYQGQNISTLRINTNPPGVKVQLAPVPDDTINDFKLFRDIVTHPVTISYLQDSDEVLGDLRGLGFQASIYEEPFEKGHTGDYDEASEHEAIWLGANVPAKVAILAIKTVFNRWPHLKYIHLSSDSSGPDYTHDEIFFGGATSTACGYNLTPWTREEIESLPDEMTIGQLHHIIRAKYPQQAHTGGPRGRGR